MKMCVGNHQANPNINSKANLGNRSYSDEQKEKCREAAKSRRSEESELLQELENLLPVPEKNHLKEESHMDKLSIIRLAIAYIKSREVVNAGFFKNMTPDENSPALDVSSCLDGFSLVIGSAGDVVFVSNNVQKYLGLGTVDLLGHPFSCFIHPCDHEQLQFLTMGKEDKSERNVEIFARVKCTVTERGRQVNLKQAGYKSVKISGKTHNIKDAKAGGLTGPVFMGIAWVVGEVGGQKLQVGVFSTKHEMDMKFAEADAWLSTVAGYTPDQLAGTSYYILVHGQDSRMVQECLAGLRTHGVCETSPYRLMCATGGHVWVQTTARVVRARQGRRRVVCRHSQISEVLNKEEVLTVAQIENKYKKKMNQTGFRTVLKRSPFASMNGKQNKRNLPFPVIIDKRQNIDEMEYVPKTLLKTHTAKKSDTKLTHQELNLQSFGFGKFDFSAQPMRCNQAQYPEPNAVTSNLFGLAMNTNSLKTSKTDKRQERNIQEISENLYFDFTKGNTDIDDSDFFTKLAESLNLEDLEKLSPHSGYGGVNFDESDSASDNLEMFNTNFSFPNWTPNKQMKISVSSGSKIHSADYLPRVGDQRKCYKEQVLLGALDGTLINMDQSKLYSDLDNLLVEERNYSEVCQGLQSGTQEPNIGVVGRNKQRQNFHENPIMASHRSGMLNQQTLLDGNHLEPLEILRKYNLNNTVQRIDKLKNQANQSEQIDKKIQNIIRHSIQLPIYDWKGPLRVNTKCIGSKRKYAESSTEVCEMLKKLRQKST